MVLPDPLQPNLEELWQEECEVEVVGPPGYKLECKVELFDRKNKLLTSADFPTATLPVPTEWFGNQFNEHVRGNPRVQAEFDEAQTILCSFIGGEIGSKTLEFEREFTPLRWIPRIQGRTYTLRLADDTGDNRQITVRHYPFETPDLAQQIQTQNAIDGIDGSERGGLYVAMGAGTTKAFVLPPAKRSFDITELRLRPRIQHFARRPFNVASFLEMISKWEYARFPGDLLAITWRNKVLTECGTYLFYVICGKKWLDGEHKTSIRGIAAGQSLVESLRFKQEEKEFAVAILEKRNEWLHLPLEHRLTRFGSLLFRYGLLLERPGGGQGRRVQRSQASKRQLTLEARKWFAELSLRLASAPGSVSKWAGRKLEPGLKRLLDERVVPCAARYIILAAQQGRAGSPDAALIRQNWVWE